MSSPAEVVPVPGERTAAPGLTRREVLLIVLVSALVILVLLTALQGFAADPMAGT